MTKLALALIYVKLVKNWQIKYTKFFNTNNLILNLNLYIKYKSITFNKNFKMPKRKKIIITSGIKLINTIFRYFIIALPI